MVLLLTILACDVPASEGMASAAWSPGPGAAFDGDDSGGGGAQGDTGDAACYPFGTQAYQTCTTEAECDPGSACTTVPGYDGAYCAPPCDPEGDASECDPDGAFDVDLYCTSAGRCARGCGEPDTCPEDLDCQEVGELGDAAVCAGGLSGTSGNYGLCSHPNEAGTDCPPETSCFGGDFIGIDSGVCLPWCDDGSCPTAPDGTELVTPYCYEAGLDHPVCFLLCNEGATCPEAQECLAITDSIGLCAPEGTEIPYAL